MRTVRKTVASASSIVAVAFASTVIFAGPAAAETGWVTMHAVAKTIPSGTGSIFLERFGIDLPGRYCMTTTNAINRGVGVHTDQTFRVTPYGDTKCTGSKTGSGAGYSVRDDLAAGSCISYGVNQAYQESRFCP